jgi:hypothetical protein
MRNPFRFTVAAWTSNAFLICTLVLAGGVASSMFMYNGVSDWLFSWHYFLTLAGAIGAIVTMLPIVFSQRGRVLKTMFISTALMIGGIAVFVERTFLNPYESLQTDGFGVEVHVPDPNGWIASAALNVASFAGLLAMIAAVVHFIRVFRRAQ